MNALTKPSPQEPKPPAAPAIDTKADVARYTGAEKAAIILMCLGEDAKKLWAMLDEEEIKEVSQAMASLGHISSATVETLVIEFVQRLSGAGSITGSYEQTQRMLTAFLPKEKVENLMEEIRGPAGRNIWDKLANVNEAVLASYLKNEYPQTVAVVLAKVRPEHAARVLGELPEDFAAECVIRMLSMEPVQREILEKIETTLKTEFMSNLARTSKRDSHELMADIFNNFDRQTEARFLASMEGKQRDSADRIRALMFVFEDLGKLDSGGVQTLLRAVDKSDLALALKGASDPLRNLFLSNMSERGSKILKEDMAAMGPVRLKDVDAAQTRMVSLAKDLSARGEIILSDGKAEDELIYLMAQIRKFAFDTEFAPSGDVLREGATLPKRLTPEELEAERATAYERGKHDELVRAEQAAAVALEAIADAASAILTRLDAESRAMREDAARIALIAARKIAGAALDAHGPERAAAAIEAAMDALRHQPRLLVKLSTEAAEVLAPRIEAMCETHAYASAVLVRAEPGMRAGEVSIDWSDGIVRHNPAEAAERINTLIEAALASAAATQ